MGHIELSAPAVPIWYLVHIHGLRTFSPVSNPRRTQASEKVIYFAANLVTWVDEDRRHEDLSSLGQYLAEKDELEKELELSSTVVIKTRSGSRNRRSRG